MTCLNLPTFWITCSCGKRTPDLNLQLQTTDEEKYSFQKLVKCSCGNEIPVLIEAEVIINKGKTTINRFNVKTI